MKNKLSILNGLMFLVFVSWASSTYWYMNRIDNNQQLMDQYTREIITVSRLVYLSTKIQQQQVMLRHHMIDDINPLIENVLATEKQINRIEERLTSPMMRASCLKCHGEQHNENWRRMPGKIHTIRKALNGYERLVSEFVTSQDRQVRSFYERRALMKATILVDGTIELGNLFKKILDHVSQKNQVNRTALFQQTFIVLAAGFVLVNILFIIFTRRFVRPVLDLEKATRLLTIGKTPEKVAVDTGDEIEQLGEAFNTMVDTLNSVTAERERLLEETKAFNRELENRVNAAREELELAYGQLARSEKLSALGTLAAGISHELSNPIHVISGLCSLMTRAAPDNPQLRKDLAVLESEAGRCQTIVQGLLDFSRNNEPVKKMVDLESLVRQTTTLIPPNRTNGQVTFNIEMAKDLPRLFIDEDKIKQVLINLLVNAIQASGDDKTITIGANSPADIHPPVISLTITDRGSGIEPAIIDRIFDPFFTTKKGREGTGLGLSISYRIIEDHGGTITVASELGRGTTFTITLPVAEGNKQIGNPALLAEGETQPHD